MVALSESQKHRPTQANIRDCREEVPMSCHVRAVKFSCRIALHSYLSVVHAESYMYESHVVHVDSYM